MNELSRAVALLVAHVVGLSDGNHEISEDERSELMALAQLLMERSEASRGYHLRPDGVAALARAHDPATNQRRLIAPSSRRKNANNPA